MTRLAIFAVVLSAICGVTFYYFSTMTPEYCCSKKMLNESAPKTTVVYATQDLQPGHQLGGNELVEQKIPTDRVPPDAIKSLAEARGRVTRLDIPGGQILSEHALVETGIKPSAKE